VPKFSGSMGGGADVHRRLAALIAASGPKVLRPAVIAGALPIQNRWKEHCAVETGTYRRSVHIGGVTRPEPGGNSDHVKQRRELPKPEEKPTEVVVTIGTDIIDPPYPWFLEHGTAHMGAHPAAQPAMDEAKEHAKAEMEAVLKLALAGAVRL
jgi:hypothetical protein